MSSTKTASSRRRLLWYITLYMHSLQLLSVCAQTRCVFEESQCSTDGGPFTCLQQSTWVISKRCVDLIPLNGPSQSVYGVQRNPDGLQWSLTSMSSRVLVMCKVDALGSCSVLRLNCDTVTNQPEHTAATDAHTICSVILEQDGIYRVVFNPDLDHAAMGLDYGSNSEPQPLTEVTPPEWVIEPEHSELQECHAHTVSCQGRQQGTIKVQFTYLRATCCA